VWTVVRKGGRKGWWSSRRGKRGEEEEGREEGEGGDEGRGGREETCIGNALNGRKGNFEKIFLLW
jgi:hypothetical protein